MNPVKLVNLTQHAVNLLVDGAALDIPPSGVEAKIITRSVARTPLQVEGLGVALPVVASEFGELENLPPPVEGTVYIAGLVVAQAAAKLGRTDVFSPDVLRNERGQVIGAKGLVAHG